MKIFKVAIIGIVCGCLLGLAHQLTSPTISANKAAHEQRQLQSIIGDKNYTIEKSATGYDLFEPASLAPVGTLKRVTTSKGYNGDIRFWLATNHQGEVLGVRIIEHQETPGLGDKLELSISEWVLDFNQTSLTNRHWDVKKHGGDFDQFSGATITPRAVVIAVHQELMLQRGGSVEP